MTDEERKRLCTDLRNVSTMWGGGSVERVTCSKAADQIERLAEACTTLSEASAAWKKAADTWESLAMRLRKDLRTGKRTCDFSFLGDDWVNINPNQPR